MPSIAEQPQGNFVERQVEYEEIVSALLDQKQAGQADAIYSEAIWHGKPRAFHKTSLLIRHG
jgi:hypothetical protein